MEGAVEKNKSNKTTLIVGIIIIVLVLGLFTNGFGLFGGGKGETSQLEIGDSPVLGDLNAPVTIYEFSDFSCPYCAAASGYNDQLINSLKSRFPNWEAPLPNIKKEYVDSGKVKIVFKYYPGHGSGKPAHLVALALQEQELFWQFHEAAFENQEDTGDLTKMKELARQIGADMNQLESSLKNNIGKYEGQLREDTQMGRKINVRGTPSFVIEGERIEGAASFSEFKKIIDRKLS
ncbi:MAG: thioredoxin domain-containing protein [Nanoarchaeota archaeon]|nr:thioredoxin domain-containing protein [Nanoarchaeota archaeon]